MERFTGGLVWITMGGRVDVCHPDGRVIRCNIFHGEHYPILYAMKKGDPIEVEIPDQRPGDGPREPRVVSFP